MGVLLGGRANLPSFVLSIFISLLQMDMLGEVLGGS